MKHAPPWQLAGFFLAVFFAGVLLLQTIDAGIGWTTVWVGTGITVCTGIATLIRRQSDARGSKILAAGLGLLTATAITWRADSALQDAGIIRFVQSRSIAVRGTIVSAPGYKNGKAQAIVAVNAVQPSGDAPWQQTSGRMYVTEQTSRRRNWAYGDRIVVYGKTELPDPTSGFAGWLRSKGVSVLMPQARTQESATGRSIRATLFTVRRSLIDHIARFYPEPHAAFLAGLLTGERGDLPSQVTTDLQRAGLTHVLAISGYNITILLSVMNGFLFFLPVKWRLVPLTVAIVLFTVFVGAEASAVRAAIMGVLGLIVLQAGRQRHARLTIAWAAFIMLLWNPLLLFDAGFQLSFLAVIGIVEIHPPLEAVTKRIPKLWGITEAVVLSLAAQSLVTPWIAYSFGQVQLLSVLSNLLVAPLVPVAMLLGTVSLVAGIIEPVGRLIAYGGWLILSTVLFIAHVIANVPFAAVELPAFPFWVVLVIYACIGVFAARMTLTTRTAAASSSPSVS